MAKIEPREIETIEMILNRYWRFRRGAAGLPYEHKLITTDDLGALTVVAATPGHWILVIFCPLF